MTINLTLQHLAAFLIFTYLATRILQGGTLIRWICWLALWQLFTPGRPISEDVPLLVMGWAATEIAWRVWRQHWGYHGK
jgi:hypothetical protein